MKNINYTFILKNNYELIDEDVINYLYQPIVGINATSLYRIVISESRLIKKFTKIKFKYSIQRLSTLMGIDDVEIKKSFDVLECMGLLAKFVNTKKENDIVYNIYRPLDPIDFFKNKNFNNLLYKKVGNEHYEFTRIIFGDEPMPIIEEEYEEKSLRFSDVFCEEEESAPQLDFSIRLRKTNPLLKDLKLNEMAKVFEKNNVCFNQEDEEIVNVIKTIYSTFNLKNKEIAEMLIDCYNFSYHKFDINKINSLTTRMLIKDANKRKPVSEINVKKNQMNIYDPELYLIKLLDVNTLTDKLHELVNKLRNMYVLTDPVINCIIDYAYLKCNNSIQEDFVLTIAKTICSKNIMNINDAMSFLIKLKSN